MPRLSPFHHVNEVNAYLGVRGGRGEIPNQKSKLEAFPCSICSSTGVLNVYDVKILLIIVSDEEHMSKLRSFNWGPLP